MGNHSKGFFGNRHSEQSLPYPWNETILSNISSQKPESFNRYPVRTHNPFMGSQVLLINDFVKTIGPRLGDGSLPARCTGLQ